MRLIRDSRGVSSVEYALLLAAILLLAAMAYRALGKDVGVSADKTKTVLEGGNATVAGNGGSASPNGAAGQGFGGGGNNGGGPAVTPPGQGPYYKNDTPIDIPPEQSEDNRPSHQNWLWKWVGLPLAGPFSGENRTFQKISLVYDGLKYIKHYDNAAGLLHHWLGGDGSPYQIDPRQMMTDLPSLGDTVQSQVQNGIANGGTFDSGWKSDSVANHMSDDTKRSSDKQVLDWYYGLNGYQYRVRGTPETVNGVQYERVTVDVFKRYNWGNPNGGGHRNDLNWPSEKLSVINIKQNDLAKLNEDGITHDFNVWGETQMLVPVNGGPPIYLSQQTQPTEGPLPSPTPGPSPVPP